MKRGLNKTLPGLENFYMVGQWAAAVIGVSNAALSGRNLNSVKRTEKKFQIKKSSVSSVK